MISGGMSTLMNRPHKVVGWTARTVRVGALGAVIAMLSAAMPSAAAGTPGSGAQPRLDAAHWLEHYCVDRFTQYTKLCMASGLSPALKAAAATYASRAGTATRSQPNVRTYPTPTKSLPIDIKNSPDGSPWFSETANTMGRVDNRTKVVTEYRLPLEAGTPYAVSGGPGNYMWFTSLVLSQYGNKIGRIDVTTHQVQVWEIPTPFSYPADLKTGPDGGIWFTETRGNKISRFDPVTFTFEEFDVGIPGALPQDIAIVDGGVWYSDQAANVIQRIDPYTHKIDTFPYPTANMAVLDIDPGTPGVEGLSVDPNTHTVWFFGMAGNRVGYINTLTHELKDFAVPSLNAIPFCGAAGPDDAIYWSEPGVNKYGRFDMRTSEITEIPIPTPGAWPVDVTKNTGSVYNALLGANAIAEIIP
jgi:virginiamycin B lyase